MQFLPKALGLSTLLAAVAVSTVQPGGAAAVQAPHRAVYDLSLSRASQGSGVNGVDGRMVFEVTGSACEGYSRHVPVGQPLQLPRGQLAVLWTCNRRASRPGMQNASTIRRRNIIDNAAGGGKAHHGGARRGRSRGRRRDQAAATRQDRSSWPAGAMFPMQHQLNVIEAAMKGEDRFVADVFDGSEDVNTVQAIATIGSRIAPGTGKDKDDPQAKPLQTLRGLAGQHRLLIRLARMQRRPTSRSTSSCMRMASRAILCSTTATWLSQGKLAKLELLPADECK